MMAVTVRLPAMLRRGSDTLTITESVHSIAQLVTALDHAQPGLAARLEDTIFNFAVNDEMLLYHARERELKEGDVVEVVPTISGG